MNDVVQITLTPTDIKVYCCNIMDWNKSVHDKFKNEFGLKLVMLKKMEIYSHDKYIFGIRLDYVSIDDDVAELKWSELKW